MEKNLKKKMYVYAHTPTRRTESLRCTPEINTTLHVDCTSVKIKTHSSGVPAVAQWVKNPTAAARVAGEVRV